MLQEPQPISGGLVAGAVIGGFSAVLTVCLIAFWLWRRRTKEKESHDELGSSTEAITPTTARSKRSRLDAVDPPPYSPWHLDFTIIFHQSKIRFYRRVAECPRVALYLNGRIEYHFFCALAHISHFAVSLTICWKSIMNVGITWICKMLLINYSSMSSSSCSSMFICCCKRQQFQILQRWKRYSWSHFTILWSG